MTNSVDDVVIDLPADLDAPALARSYTAQHAAALPADLVSDAELLVSELVTNAVRYGRPTITLRLRLDPPGIGVAVHDHGDALPASPAGRPDLTSESGRGLLIVATLATEWGVDPSPDGVGKTVWFQLSPAS